MANTGFEHQRATSGAGFAASVARNLGSIDGGAKSYLKRSLVETFVRTAHKVIVNCKGIRAEGWSSSSRLAPLVLSTSLTILDPTVYNRFLIFAHSLAECARRALGEGHLACRVRR